MQTPTVAIEKRVEQYVQLRDLIKEIEQRHKEELQPYKDGLEALNGSLLKHLNAIGAESVRTNHGTVYRTNKDSATIADPKAFWDYVVTSKEFELIDKRANKTAVRDYIDDNGAPPPGGNYTQVSVVGVRRS